MNACYYIGKKCNGIRPLVSKKTLVGPTTSLFKEEKLNKQHEIKKFRYILASKLSVDRYLCALEENFHFKNVQYNFVIFFKSFEITISNSTR